MIEPSRPYSPAPLWKTLVAISAVVIWKFMPNVPSTKTSAMMSMMSGRPRDVAQALADLRPCPGQRRRRAQQLGRAIAQQGDEHRDEASAR